MRASALAREIGRDLTSGTARLGMLFAVAAATLVLLVLSDVLPTTTGIRQGLEYQASGAAVTTLAAPGRIDGRACEALTQAPGVQAAGAMRKADPVSLTTLPGSPLDRYVTTGTFPLVLGAVDRTGEGVSVSDDVADTLGPDTVPISGHVVPLRGQFAYPTDGRRAGFGWAVLSPTFSADGAFDECWVAAWPQRAELRALLMATMTPPNGAANTVQPEIAPLNARMGAQFTGAAAFTARPSRFAPLIAIGLAALLAAGGVWLRRVEIASNMHAGTRHPTLVWQLVAESAAWAVPAAAAAWSIGLIVAIVLAPSELGALSAITTLITGGFVIGAAAGAVGGVFAIREDRLWAYAKGR